jgi:SAM-dependent methyltransferase
MPISIEGLSFIRADGTNLSSFSNCSIDSISSLHAIEHFGLGRYGDEIDPLAWKKVLWEIQRVLRVGGHAYISVPVGRKRVEFNGGRVFDPAQIRENLPLLELVEFSLIDDHETMTQHVALEQAKDQIFACGLFHLTRRQ